MHRTACTRRTVETDTCRHRSARAQPSIAHRTCRHRHACTDSTRVHQTACAQPTMADSPRLLPNACADSTGVRRTAFAKSSQCMASAASRRFPRARLSELAFFRILSDGNNYTVTLPLEVLNRAFAPNWDAPPNRGASTLSLCMPPAGIETPCCVSCTVNVHCACRQQGLKLPAVFQWIVAHMLLPAFTTPGFNLSHLQKSYRIQHPRQDWTSSLSRRGSSSAAWHTPIFGHVKLDAMGSIA